jgi:hypothetical protein
VLRSAPRAAEECAAVRECNRAARLTCPWRPACTQVTTSNADHRANVDRLQEELRREREKTRQRLAARDLEVRPPATIADQLHCC